MKKSRDRIGAGLIMIILIFIPVQAGAGTVPWVTEEYRAYAQSRGWLGDIQQELWGPPLPISAYASGDPSFSFASSDITGTAMSIWTYDESHSGALFYPDLSNANADFSGSFMAVDPLFQLSYSYNAVVNINDRDNLGPGSDDKYWINIYDVTSSTSLYSNTVIFNSGSSSGSNILNISTPLGHQISVDFGIQAGSYNGAFRSDETTIDFTYSTAVVPEPISSILFVTGGALLAGRGFIRRQSA